jgi:hypothetical protein
MTKASYYFDWYISLLVFIIHLISPDIQLVICGSYKSLILIGYNISAATSYSN